MNIYKKILDGFIKIVRVLLIVSVLGIVALMLNELVIRNVLNKSFRGMTELAGLLFLWMAFLGITVLYDKEELISIDMIYSRTQGKLRTVFWFVRHAVTLGLGIVMIVSFCGLYPFVVTEYYSSMPNLSKMWQFLPLAVSGGFFVLKAVYTIIEKSKQLRGDGK